MSKHTYLIEYFEKGAPTNVYQTLWSDDELLEESFLITDKDVHSIYLTEAKSRLGCYLTTFPNRERTMRDLWYRKDEWVIQATVLNKYKNTFEYKECKGISELLYSYLHSLSNAMHLLEYESLTDEDVDDLKKKLSQYDISIITNYLYVKALSPFVLNINKVKTLNEILTIAKDIEHILGKYILNFDLSEDLVCAQGVYHNLRSVISSEIPKISNLFITLTEPLGFLYKYTPYVTFSQYFRRLKRIIEMEIEYRIASTNDKEEAKEVDISKWMTKDEVIAELVPYRNNELFIKLLDKINHRYKIPICSKLDIACIFLLLREYCALINKDSVKTFKKFMAKMCIYFDIPQISYKENDCIERKKEILKKDEYFWETTVAKKYSA